MPFITRLWLPLVMMAVPLSAQAQDFEAMLQMISDMQTAQACIMGIDASTSPELIQKTELAKQQIAGLCAKELYAEAQQFAWEFGIELTQDETVKTIPACNTFASDALPRIEPSPVDGTVYGQHVCTYL